MSPSRKRPQCQKCGNLMAGHKRPNGIPTCPTDRLPESPVTKSPLRREVAVIDYGRPGEVSHYRNPNWTEPEAIPMPYIQRPIRHSGTPDSWVSTEPADDIPYLRVKHERMLSVLRESDEVQTMIRPSSMASSSGSSVASSTSSTSSRLRRSFTSILSSSVPLLSVFSAQREDLSRITTAARRNGLHTGVLRPPGTPIVKEESESGSTFRRRFWVLVGTDPEAVEHIMDLQEKETIARLDRSDITSTPTPSPQLFANHSTEKPYQFSTGGLITLVCFVCGMMLLAAVILLSAL